MSVCLLHPGGRAGRGFGGVVQFSKRLDFKGVNFENAQNVSRAMHALQS